MPSIVLISAPSACAASRVHDLTALPFRWTVHAPQLDVSHPTWVPVKPSVSRRKWTRSRRGSTSALFSAPLTVIVTRTEPAIRLLPVGKLGGAYLSRAAAVVGERELAEDESILGLDVREAQRDVLVGDPDGLGERTDLAVRLDEA